MKASTTYDWIKIKQEFFVSEYLEAYVFVKDVYLLDANTNGAVGRRVRGWSNEKLELRRAGLENAKRQLVAMYLPTAEELANMHKAVMGLLKMVLQKELNNCIKIDAFGAQTIVKMPDIRTVTEIWKIIKAEKLELGPVKKTSEGISEENRELMRKLLEQQFDDED